MIDKKIEEFARAYGKLGESPATAPKGSFSLELETAFEIGAHWALKEFLKDLWHPADEEPKKGRVFLYKTIFEGYGINQIIDGNERKYIIKYQRATQWLYIDDLFPKKGGYHD